MVRVKYSNYFDALFFFTFNLIPYYKLVLTEQYRQIKGLTKADTQTWQGGRKIKAKVMAKSQLNPMYCSHVLFSCYVRS